MRTYVRMWHFGFLNRLGSDHLFMRATAIECESIPIGGGSIRPRGGEPSTHVKCRSL